MTEIDNGTIVRYCKPSTLDEQRKPCGSSFALRTHINEKELSIHLLDYFNNPSEKEKVKAVKEWQKNFNFNTNALFATLDIKESQDYIFNKIRLTRQPNIRSRSHVRVRRSRQRNGAIRRVNRRARSN